jgi:DNA polymerase-3 subunit alpha
MHPLTEGALKNTYGIPVYQEQVMQVAKDMAGFTPGEADTLRKAMGKKIAKLMAELRVKFVEGSVKKGVEQKTAEAIFTQFEEFAAYGFNKSHAACYALIAYQTAYLKAHFPDCFMAALLNTDCQLIDRVTIEVEECRRMGLEVLPPDVNESFKLFSVVKGTNKLRFGLLAIKGLGEDIVEGIYRERKASGPFKDLADFATRITHKAFNRKSLESLIRSGALDGFGDRNALYFNIDTILDYHRRVTEETSSGQTNLFAVVSTGKTTATPLQLKPAPPATERDILLWEKELLGLYVSAHPFKEYAERLQGLFTPLNILASKLKEKSVRIGGMLTASKKILTKNNEPMVFGKLEDLTGDIEVVVFPRIYRDKPEVWEGDHALVVAGRVQEKEGELKFLVESAYEITPDNIDDIAKYIDNSGARKNEAREPSNSTDPRGAARDHAQAVTLYLRAQLPETILHKLRHVLDQHPGRFAVYFAVDNAGGKQKILSSYKIAYDELISKELEAILGTGTVRVET